MLRFAVELHGEGFDGEGLLGGAVFVVDFVDADVGLEGDAFDFVGVVGVAVGQLDFLVGADGFGGGEEEILADRRGVRILWRRFSPAACTCVRECGEGRAGAQMSLKFRMAADLSGKDEIRFEGDGSTGILVSIKKGRPSCQKTGRPSLAAGMSSHATGRSYHAKVASTLQGKSGGAQG